MGGQLDWAALPIVAEILGEEDIEVFCTRLAALRRWKLNNT